MIRSGIARRSGGTTVNRHAYSVVEMLIVIVVVGIVAVVAWPDPETAQKEQARLAAERFENDVTFARSLTIRDPSDPTAIKVEPDNNRYMVTKKSAPDTPINHPVKKKPYIVQFGPGGEPGLELVKISGAELGGDAVIVFEPEGRLDQSIPAVLQLLAGDVKAEVTVAPAAAAIKINEEYTKTVSLIPVKGELVETEPTEEPKEINVSPK